jgi:hypothetical protein
MQISFSSRQPDANFIQLVAIQMQISFNQPPAGCKLYPASGHAIQNTQFATNQMKFAFCWRLAECKFCINQRLAHCKAASVLQARWDDIF